MNPLRNPLTSLGGAASGVPMLTWGIGEVTKDTSSAEGWMSILAGLFSIVMGIIAKDPKRERGDVP